MVYIMIGLKQLLNKWYAEKSQADSHNLTSSKNYSNAIAHNENAYGKQPPKLPLKKATLLEGF